MYIFSSHRLNNHSISVFKINVVTVMFIIAHSADTSHFRP